jgi:hypothetical protein
LKGYFTLSVFLFLAAYSSAQKLTYVEKDSFPDAIAYNDYIVDMMDIIDEGWTLAIEEEASYRALEYADSLKTRSGRIIASLQKLKGYEGETKFRQAALDYAIHMNTISKKELPDFIRLIRIGELTESKRKEATALLPILDNKREKLFALIEKAQAAFAKKYHFKPVSK